MCMITHDPSVLVSSVRWREKLAFSRTALKYACVQREATAAARYANRESALARFHSASSLLLTPSS